MSGSMNEIQKMSQADKAGVCLSGLCVVHCFLSSIAFLFPAYIAHVFHFEAFHIVSLVLLVPVTFFAFYSQKKVHGKLHPSFMAAFGLLMFIGSISLDHVFPGADGLVNLASISGGAILIGAHFMNYRSTRACCHSKSIPCNHS
jgi:hypothetical protein